MYCDIKSSDTNLLADLDIVSMVGLGKHPTYQVYRSVPIYGNTF